RLRGLAPRAAPTRAPSPPRVPPSSIESRMSRSVKAFTMKPPEGIACSRPSSSSRTSASRTGVRETPVISTACNSLMRSPGRSRPDRIMSRSASCARTVCETERSASRSPMTLLRCLHGLRSGFARDHAVDHASRPHRTGVDVEVVEGALRIFVHHALLRFEDDFILVEDAGNPLADFSGQLLFGGSVTADEGPEIVTGGVGLRRHGVEHNAVDALRAVAFRRAGAGGRHADVDIDGAGRLEMDDLPAVDRA